MVPSWWWNSPPAATALQVTPKYQYFIKNGDTVIFLTILKHAVPPEGGSDEAILTFWVDCHQLG